MPLRAPRQRPRGCALNLLALALALTPAAPGARALDNGAVDGDDVSTARQRMLLAYGWPASWGDSPSALAADVAEARSLASRLLPNGTWPDVNYSDPQDRTIWLTAQHTQRVQLMAAAVSFAASPAFNDPALFDPTRRAFEAWLVGNYTNGNWWWTILQTPQTVAVSFLMLDTLPPVAGRTPFPSAYELSASLAVTFRAAWWDSALGYIVTGANLAWLVQAQLLRAVWPSNVNASALDGGFARLWEEVKIAPWVPGCGINGACNGTNQGIQADASWHFHGPQLQTAQYGQDALSDDLAFMAVADGTRWAMPADRAQILCFFVAGMAWASAGPGMDWAAAGRAMDRSSWGAVSKVVVNATLLHLLAPRCNTSELAAVVAAFADSLNSSAPTAAVVQGNRHFWTSDYMVHKRLGWSASWHGLSNRTMPNECGNGENLLGIYETQGLLNLVEEGLDSDGRGRCELGAGAGDGSVTHGPLGWGCGLEYATVFPLLDWVTLNGATALSDLPLPPCGKAVQCCWESALVASRRPFVGGASDGTFGIVAMDHAYLTLTARKATLFFDSAVLSLGADMNESSGATAVRTGLASRFLRGDAQRTGLTLGLADGSTRFFAANSSDTAADLSLPTGGAGSGALAFAFADSVGWLTTVGDGSPYPPARVRAGPREAPWSSIGVFPGNMSGNTLSISIEQGAGGGAPLVGASFATVLVPRTTAAAIAVAARPGGLSSLGLDARAISNSRSLQAAAQTSLTDLVLLAAFLEAGTYEATPSPWPRAVSVAVDAPCLLTLHETLAGGGGGGGESVAVLAVANPDTYGLVVRVALGGAARPGCAPITVALNNAALSDFLGRSEVVQLRCGAPPACCVVAAAG